MLQSCTLSIPLSNQITLSLSIWIYLFLSLSLSFFLFLSLSHSLSLFLNLFMLQKTLLFSSELFSTRKLAPNLKAKRPNLVWASPPYTPSVLLPCGPDKRIISKRLPCCKKVTVADFWWFSWSSYQIFLPENRI